MLGSTIVWSLLEYEFNVSYFAEDDEGFSSKDDSEVSEEEEEDSESDADDESDDPSDSDGEDGLREKKLSNGLLWNTLDNFQRTLEATQSTIVNYDWMLRLNHYTVMEVSMLSLFFR